jgi:hypothetical protein
MSYVASPAKKLSLNFLHRDPNNHPGGTPGK